MTLKHGLLVLLALSALAAAAPPDLNGDGQWDEKDAFIAAGQALENTTRTLNRWALITAGLIVAVAVVSIWRVFAYGRKLAELDFLRASTEKRFNEFSDEILRAKRKAAEAEQNVGRMEAEVAQVRGLVGDHGPTDLAGVERQLLELRAEIARVTESAAALQATLGGLEQSVALARQHSDEAAAASAGLNEVLDGFGERLSALETRPAAPTGQRPEEPAQKPQPQPEPQPEPEPGQDKASAPEPESPESAKPARRTRAKPGEPPAAGETRIEPDFAGLLELARSRLAEGDFDSALAEAGRLRDAAGGDTARAAAAEIVAGAAQVNLGDMDRAVMALERAVELDRDARQAIARDETIARFVASGHKQAAKFCREVNKFIAPIRMKPPAGHEPAPAKSRKQLPRRGRR
jgi:tetratricopeptide (TPR) repeat protein